MIRQRRIVRHGGRGPIILELKCGEVRILEPDATRQRLRAGRSKFGDFEAERGEESDAALGVGIDGALRSAYVKRWGRLDVVMVRCGRRQWSDEVGSAR